MDLAPESPSRPMRLGIAAAIYLLSFVCFSPALSGTFLNWDDNQVLTSHEAWRGLGWEQISWMFGTFHSGHYHPLTWLTFGLDHTLWGMNPGGYHLTNLLFHAANAVLFYLLIVAILGPPGRETIGAHLAAAAGALLFALHPLRVESVAWITERRDVLSGFFYLLTLLAYLKWCRGGENRRRWYAMALACFACSLLAKAWGITLPAVLLILDAWPLRRFEPGRRRAVLIEKLPFLALAIAGAVIAYFAQKQAGAMDLAPEHTALRRIVQSAYGLGFYAWKSVLPVDLNPLYQLRPTFNPFEARYLAGAAGAVALTLVCILLRRRRPEILAAWVAYAVIVSPVLGLTQAGPQVVAGRYTYLACLPLALLAAAGLLRLMERPGWSRRVPVAAAALLILIGSLAWKESWIWRDSISLWTRALDLDPENSQAWHNRGEAKFQRRDFAAAIADFDEALERNPRDAGSYLNRGLSRIATDPDAALADFEAALRADPRSADAHNNRGWIRMNRREFDRALPDFEAAIRINPGHVQAIMNRGIIKFHLKDLAGAAGDLERAIRLKPGDPNGYYLRGQVRQGGGDLDGAIADYAKALSLASLTWESREQAERMLAAARKQKGTK